MEVFIKANGKKILDMEKVYSFLKMAILMMANGKMTKEPEKANTFGQMEPYTKEIAWMDFYRARVRSIGHPALFTVVAGLATL